MMIRKHAIRTAIAGLALSLAVGAAAAGDFKVTLLGTATPAPRPDRFGPSTLIEAGDQRVLIDAGRGAAVRLWQMKIPVGSLNGVILTHFHSDHTNGLPDLWLTGWIGTPYGGRKTPFRVFGPTGTQQLTDGIKSAYDADVQIRLVDEGNPPEGIAIETHEFAAEGVIYDEGGLRITAFTVNHGEHIKPAYGMVAEYDGRKVLISGDTKFEPNIIKHGKGVDLMIHEVATARPDLMQRDHARRVMEHHLTPQEAGTVFSETSPKLAVYTHITRLSDKDNPEPSLTDIVDETRQTYQGPLVVGEDLMTFDIGKSGIATYMAGAR